ncbi:hypothetical protein Salat_2490700 [Sesamum alatum]|uniref:Uncharacterized protein n=1 Tax=Sesamum alatum TaxID=300844 RepID=A0AAE1XS77_9LAMI|nr:hypothetical protein Salat_2490700 [Sesamum alatum]
MDYSSIGLINAMVQVNMTAPALGVNEQPPILPPVVEDSAQTQPEVEPQVLHDTGPSQTQPSMQGPTMYEQLQMGQPSMPAQPPMTLQPRLNIRALPPMTGTGFMPCFSYKPAFEVSKSIIKEHGKKFVDLSKWPSQSSNDEGQK